MSENILLARDGGIATVTIILESFAGGEYGAEGARALGIELIEMIDLFLLGTILMITSVGLYQLFIQPSMHLPESLVVADLQQLKFNLLALIVIMLTILFLGEAAGDLAGTDGILEYGLAIAAVLAGVALVVWVFQSVVTAEEEHIHEMLLEARGEAPGEDTGGAEG